MPLLPVIPPSENIKNLLRTARTETAKQSLKEILEEKLTVDDIVENIAEILRDSTNDPTRLRAAELGSKLHGIINPEDTKTIPVINVYINGNVEGINPILFPRS